MIDLCPLLSDKKKDIISAILPLTSILSGNMLEFNQLLKISDYNNIIEFMSSHRNLNEIYIKKGDKGAEYYYRDNKGQIQKMIYICDSNIVAKNTTGCGDVFNAVVLSGKCYNFNDDKIIKKAVFESGVIAERELPWI